MTMLLLLCHPLLSWGTSGRGSSDLRLFHLYLCHSSPESQIFLAPRRMISLSLRSTFRAVKYNGPRAYRRHPPRPLDAPVL